MGVTESSPFISPPRSRVQHFAYLLVVPPADAALDLEGLFDVRWKLHGCSCFRINDVPSLYFADDLADDPPRFCADLIDRDDPLHSPSQGGRSRHLRRSPLPFIPALRARGHT